MSVTSPRDRNRGRSVPRWQQVVTAQHGAQLLNALGGPARQVGEGPVVRKKLSQATGGYHHIETVWGRGYVLRDPAVASGKTAAGIDRKNARAPVSNLADAGLATGA
jgi:hypothetical protein